MSKMTEICFCQTHDAGIFWEWHWRLYDNTHIVNALPPFLYICHIFVRCNLLEVHHSSGNVTPLIASNMLMRTPAERLFLWGVKPIVSSRYECMSLINCAGFVRERARKIESVRGSKQKRKGVFGRERERETVRWQEARKADWQRRKAEQVMEMHSDRNPSLVHPVCPGGSRRERGSLRT